MSKDDGYFMAVFPVSQKGSWSTIRYISARITKNIKPIATQAFLKPNSFPIVVKVKGKVSVIYKLSFTV